MKRIKYFILSILLALYLFIPFSVGATSWKFIWTETKVYVPVFASIEEYKNIPRANLYKNEVLLTDTKITYNTEGDWLYYFKDINTKVLGSYPVWYKAYDSKYSPGTCTGYKALVTFEVIDDIPPKITIHNPFFRVRRGSNIDISSNYSVKDNYALEEVKVIESINTSRVGTYPVTVIARDSSNNESRKDFKVIVYEDEAPVISSDLLDQEIRIPLNGEFDIKSHFTAVDSVEGDITSKIMFPEILNDTIGEKEYTISVSNQAGLFQSYKLKVIVVDDIKPEIELSLHSLILDYETDFSSFDFEKYIKKISDNQEINYDNLTISHNLINEVGSYQVWYSYTDGIYNVSDSIDISLISKEKPEIYVEDIEVNVGDSINLYDYVFAYDASDSDISSTLEIYDTKVDYSKAGTYYAEAYCINSSGKSVTLPFKVIVKDKGNTINSNNLYFIGMIVSISFSFLMLVFVVFFIIITKKKRKE